MSKVKNNYDSLTAEDFKKIEEELLEMVIKGAAADKTKTVHDFFFSKKIDEKK